MPEFEPRPLHLHTLDTLIADLVGGRAVLISEGHQFALSGDRARSALNWYRTRGEARWASNVSSTDGEALVTAIGETPPELPATAGVQSGSEIPKLSLRKVRVHRFAGIHKFGTPETPPLDFEHEFHKPLTLLEGRNGSGKTSILNAIIWGLTGQLLRPQREPESAKFEFECSLDRSDDGEPTEQKLTPVTPLPDAAIYRSSNGIIPLDTWVELTFVNDEGETFSIRRTQSRNNAGRLVETEPDLTVLNVDPIAVRIGTIMPGLLGHIQIGSASELSEAVAKLTGLSSLVDLANHAKRAQKNISGDYTTRKEDDRSRADLAYLEVKAEIESTLSENPNLSPPSAIPSPSNDRSIEDTLRSITDYYEEAKEGAFQSAQSILGTTFDPGDKSQQDALAKNCPLALDRIGSLGQLTSLDRLSKLRRTTSDDLDDARSKIAEIVDEGQRLSELAQNPSLGARQRLYARVAAWIAEHPDPDRPEDECAVCGGSLVQSFDPVTGQPVHQHLTDVADAAELLSLTMTRWAQIAEGALSSSIGPALASELSTDLPDHPCDLIRRGIVDELFVLDPFQGVLQTLKNDVSATFDGIVANRPDLTAATQIALPDGCTSLRTKLQRLDKAVRFARWRQENDSLVNLITEKVLGKVTGDSPVESNSLAGKLSSLLDVVRGAKPISDILAKCATLQRKLQDRRTAEKRLAEYAVAASALSELSSLGDLAAQQVDQLQLALRDEAAKWRDRIYESAFPTTAHELAGTSTGAKGELNIAVRKDGYSAPAQHVTNASALRASLTGFYLAFWEHVLTQRGGLRLMLLDDPQDLLDENNKENLARAIGTLAAAGAEPIVTSYDARFAADVARLSPVGSLDHFSVDPCTSRNPKVRLTPSVRAIFQKKTAFEGDVDNAAAARDYANECRIFLENKLASMFDDPAHAAWSANNPHPTLADFVARLRPLVRQNPQGMFGGGAFRRFIDHPALVDGSPTIRLMNKSHHGQAGEITATEVSNCSASLHELIELVDEMYLEAYLWRRREALGANDNGPVELPTLGCISAANLNVRICPDLAAFTHHGGLGETQAEMEMLDPNALSDKTMFYLRRDNFGFAAPQGSIALAESIPAPVGDRRLVIARTAESILARRLLKPEGSTEIGLAAEVPDPRYRNPKTLFLPQAQVELHQVVGILFEPGVTVGNGQEEAVEIDDDGILERVEIAYRVIDDSAVPLALSKQVVLGGRIIPLEELRSDSLVALRLDDGASIFKRVGKRLPGDLKHIRQFESIGGLGSSEVLSVGQPHLGFREVLAAREIIGVLYNA